MIHAARLGVGRDELVGELRDGFHDAEYCPANPSKQAGEKLQIPSTNLQRNFKLQPPNKNPACRTTMLEAWFLELLWSLVLGIWSLFSIRLAENIAEWASLTSCWEAWMRSLSSIAR